jgi:hypothetical protein
MLALDGSADPHKCLETHVVMLPTAGGDGIDPKKKNRPCSRHNGV